MAFTFFFRDRHTLEQKVNLLISGLNQNDPIKVWDAGCAMGPEPYTFAIILAQAIGREWFRKVEIIASDIDETSNFKEIVNNGVYRKFDLSRMPENIFEKYFLKYDDNDHYQIDDMIRKSVKFVTHDLLSLKPFDNNFNAVICKNVLLHFQYEQRIEVIKMFHQVLKPGGLLTVEQTQPMPAECNHLFEKAVPDANVFRRI